MWTAPCLQERGESVMRIASPAVLMWTAPCLQERGESVMRIACVHMCGLSARMDAAELAFATRVPNNDAALTAVASGGVSRVLDRPITPSARSHASSGLWRGRIGPAPNSRSPFLCSAGSRFSVPATTRRARRAQRLSRSAARKRRDRVSGAAGVLDGVEPGATIAQSGEAPRIRLLPRAGRRWPGGSLRAGADRRTRPSPSSSRRCARPCWRARPRRAWAACA